MIRNQSRRDIKQIKGSKTLHSRNWLQHRHQCTLGIHVQIFMSIKHAHITHFNEMSQAIPFSLQNYQSACLVKQSFCFWDNCQSFFFRTLKSSLLQTQWEYIDAYESRIKIDILAPVCCLASILHWASWALGGTRVSWCIQYVCKHSKTMVKHWCLKTHYTFVLSNTCKKRINK